MIRGLSETLRAMLDDKALKDRFKDLFDASISFERPDEGFQPSQATVNLFLYDVRENMELRSNEQIIERHKAQATIHRAPLRVGCSYLVTAWPGKLTGDDLALGEHRLLSQALQVLARYPTIPADFLKDTTLEGQ